MQILQKKRILNLAVITILSLSSSNWAATHYGAVFNTVLSSKEPLHLHGYQILLNYEPDIFHWMQINLYFDGGFSHLWIHHVRYSNINIYSLAPVIRYYFGMKRFILPYLELSVGLAYLDQIHLEKRKLGIHFAFQDRLGLGMLLGRSQNLSLGIHATHYSNAHLSKHNSGITLPLVLDVGFRFS